MDGKRIEGVYWPDTESEQGRSVQARHGVKLHLSATHHGDHDEFWIVESRVITGEEIARHNPRYIETFIWETK